MRDKRSLGCAALIGAVIAFPAGMMAGGGTGRQQAEERLAGEARPAKSKQAVRDVYSPSIRDDPYVIEQQLRVVEALELSCRRYRERCTEAQKARERIEENKAR